MQVIDLALCVF